jgi:drug/metabolite transporter (DMT)-like permease
MTAPANALSLKTALLLVVPPLLWAGNAVVGRLVYPYVPPLTLNFLRWVGAFLLLLPLAHALLRANSPIWSHWRRYALLGLLGVGCYNSFQYLALHTSSPINVTLVASSGPVFMLAIGALFFGQRIRPQQLGGAALSILGVLFVLSRGDPATLLQVKWVIGDIYVLIATACWSFYSWLLSQDKDPPGLRNNWAQFLMAQVIFGLGWGGLFSGLEWGLTPAHIEWNTTVWLALIYVAIGPAILAYRCWGLGVQQAGPNVAGFFANLTPLFAAVISTVMLGDAPQTYHGLAFALIVGGIWVSSRKPSTSQT